MPFNLTFNLWFVHSILTHECTCMYIVFTHFNEMLEKLEKVQSSFQEVRIYLHCNMHVLMRDERRKKERSKQSQKTKKNKAKQHKTKAVTFPEKMSCMYTFSMCNNLFRHEL